MRIAALVVAVSWANAIGAQEFSTPPCTGHQSSNCRNCDCSNAWAEPRSVLDGIEVSGWLQAGYHSESDGRLNSHPGRANLHQVYVSLEKKVDGTDHHFGFRADAIYGLDGPEYQSFGNNRGRWDFQDSLLHGSYGWAFPQAYLQVGYGEFTVIAGHFFSPAGLEYLAPENVFYSYSLPIQPITHTGVGGIYSPSDQLEIYSGWTAGWDTGFDQLGQGSMYFGGVKATPTEEITATYFCTIGDVGDTVFGNRGEGYHHSLVTVFQLTDKLTYAIQSDVLRFESAGRGDNDAFGIANFWFYSLSKMFTLGLRAEWWKSDQGHTYGGQTTPSFESTSFYEVTAGVNLHLLPTFRLRPELRTDWSPGLDFQQSAVAVDAIWTF